MPPQPLPTLSRPCRRRSGSITPPACCWQPRIFVTSRPITAPVWRAEPAQLELVPRAVADPSPPPRNFWPAPDAPPEARLQAVLDAWQVGTAATSADSSLDPLAEHVPGHNTSAVLLARVTVPVIL